MVFFLSNPGCSRTVPAARLGTAPWLSTSTLAGCSSFCRIPAFLLIQFKASHMFLPMNPASRRHTGTVFSFLFPLSGLLFKFDPLIPGTKITGRIPSGGKMQCTGSVIWLGVRVQVCTGLPRALYVMGATRGADGL